MEVMTSFHVRPMFESDLDAVVAIENSSYSNPWTHEHFRAEITAEFSWPSVAIADGAVIGYVCLMSLFEEAQILNIAVSQNQRGRGVAWLLLEHAFVQAFEKGAEFMALEVRASNSGALSLYEKFGFIRVGIRPRYYESVEDAILMEKPIKENR